MQILLVIMRLLVILSASLFVVRASGTFVNYSVVAATVIPSGATMTTANRTGQDSGGDTLLVLSHPNSGSVPVVASNGAVQPKQRSIQSIDLPSAQSTNIGQSVLPKNVYRTKLSKLKLILLADMLNEMPSPMELITCLSNSSSLNVTTKHCDCESYSCKDLLTSSSGSSPFNLVNQRKIHATCRDHCCRKKKFNRSIEPTFQNAVAAVFRHSSIASIRTKSASGEAHLEPAGRISSTPLQLMTPVSASGGSSSSQTHPTSARVHSSRDCTADPIIATNLDRLGQGGSLPHHLPWLYRIVLIEKAQTICVGTLVHPNVLLTTAVCVINKNPNELIARRQSAESDRNFTTSDSGEELSRAVRRILLPGLFAKTFERLENNVALLVLQQDEDKQQQKPQQPSDDRLGTVREKQVRQGSGTGAAWPPLQAEQNPPIVPNEWSTVVRSMAPGHLPDPVVENKRNFPEPSYICLSSIINHPSVGSNICRTYSWRKLRGTAVFLPGIGHQRDAGDAGGGTVGKNLRRNQRPRHRARYQSPPQQRQIWSDDGTNYVTANISIFPANGNECRREHRDYLQHQGNLCAGPVDRSQTLDVDFSGSPLICMERGLDGQVRVQVRGILTWSTDINRAPHLFTNVTTYRSWIEDELYKLEP
ncbi:uncharacterized protein LOC131438387 isoform X2 [Malaya genurostris]|uniref:uncharacterized protein LOC131438387 isoform X2 n=1 Tax=Malaya genurostris TaxID=325434 RepID=UPI0026F3E8BC|nr:uncharacterized protein LOC131438387 isoform X2 [Malaya genurostris]